MRKPLVLAFVSILILSFFLPLVPVEAQSWTDISSLPYVISASGNYRITQNINYVTTAGGASGGYYGILINASNVVLDGQHFFLNETSALSYHNTIYIGYYYYDGVGSNAFNYSNIVVQNFNVRTWGGFLSTPYEKLTKNLQVLNCVSQGDIMNGGGDGIAVPNSENVYIYNCTLSGGREGISGAHASIIHQANITITDCRITDFEYGITTHSSRIYNTNISRCTVGIELRHYDALPNGYLNIIDNCRFVVCSLGVWIENVDAEITNNDFINIGSTVPASEEWQGGVLVNYVGNVTIADNTFTKNNYALALTMGSDTIGFFSQVLIYDNQFIENDFTFFFYMLEFPEFPLLCGVQFFNNYLSDYSFFDYQYWEDPVPIPSATFFFLNTTIQAGTPITGAGSYIGGNYWGNPIGTGWSQTHSPNVYGFTVPFDLFGDESVFDYLPLTGNAPNPSGQPTPSPTPYIPPTMPQTEIDLYFHGSTTTVNTIAGYVASPSPPRVSASVNESDAADSDVSFGVRVYVVSATGSSVELTSGVHTIGTVTNGENATNSLLQSDLAVPLTSLTFRQSSLVFRYYVRFDSGAWIVKAVFTTEALDYKKILPTNWTFNLYVSRSESGGTLGEFAWGDPDYLSGVDGLLFKDANPTDWQMYYLNNHNFVMFIMVPYTLVLGNIFYGIVLIAIAGTLFIRYRTLGMSALFLLIILGCVGGGAGNLIFGEILVGVLWIMLAFGLAVLYWRAFR